MIDIVVSKKRLNRAVDRNRVRRRIRAALDSIKPNWRKSLTGAVYGNEEMLTLPFPELKTRIVFLLQKAKIL